MFSSDSCKKKSHLEVEILSATQTVNINDVNLPFLGHCLLFIISVQTSAVSIWEPGGYKPGLQTVREWGVGEAGGGAGTSQLSGQARS